MLSLSLAFTVSCIFNPKYTYSESMSPDAASVVGYYNRIDSTIWERFSLLAVDDYFIKSNISGFNSVDELFINYGSHILTVRVNFNRGIGTGPYEAIIPISANLHEKTKYRIVGKINQGQVSVWIEDIKTGSRITEIQNGNYK